MVRTPQPSSNDGIICAMPATLRSTNSSGRGRRASHSNMGALCLPCIYACCIPQQKYRSPGSEILSQTSRQMVSTSQRQDEAHRQQHCKRGPPCLASSSETHKRVRTEEDALTATPWMQVETHCNPRVGGAPPLPVSRIAPALNPSPESGPIKGYVAHASPIGIKYQRTFSECEVSTATQADSGTESPTAFRIGRHNRTCQTSNMIESGLRCKDEINRRFHAFHNTYVAHIYAYLSTVVSLEADTTCSVSSQAIAKIQSECPCRIVQGCIVEVLKRTMSFEDRPASSCAMVTKALHCGEAHRLSQSIFWTGGEQWHECPPQRRVGRPPQVPSWSWSGRGGGCFP